MIMTYYCIIIVPKSHSFRCAVAALISHFHVVTLGIGGKAHIGPATYRKMPRAKQNEQPDSPIKTCALPEVHRPDYQEQGEVKSTE